MRTILFRTSLSLVVVLVAVAAIQKAQPRPGETLADRDAAVIKPDAVKIDLSKPMPLPAEPPPFAAGDPAKAVAMLDDLASITDVKPVRPTMPRPPARPQPFPEEPKPARH